MGSREWQEHCFDASTSIQGHGLEATQRINHTTVGADWLSPSGELAPWATMGASVEVNERQIHLADWHKQNPANPRIAEQLSRAESLVSSRTTGTGIYSETFRRIHWLGTGGIYHVPTCSLLGSVTVTPNTAWWATACCNGLFAWLDPFGQVIVSELASAQTVHMLSVDVADTFYSGFLRYASSGRVLVAVTGTDKNLICGFDVEAGRQLYRVRTW